MHRLNSILATLVVIGSLAVALPAGAAAPKVERIDSREARITLVNLDQNSEGLGVSGKIQKRFMRRGRIPGELLISLIATDGEVLEQKHVVYRRRQRNTGKAYFTVDFVAPAQRVDVVRIQHLWPSRF